MVVLDREQIEKKDDQPKGRKLLHELIVMISNTVSKLAF